MYLLAFFYEPYPFCILFLRKIEGKKYIYLYNGFPNPSLYQRTILTRSVGDDGVILHGKLVNIPETDCIRVTGTAKEPEERKIKSWSKKCYLVYEVDYCHTLLTPDLKTF